MYKIWLCVAIILVAYNYPRAADFSFSGQVRTRGEYRNNKDFSTKSLDEVEFANMRFRLKADAKVNENLSASATIQDSRIYGSSGASVTSTSPLEGVRFTATNSLGLESIDLLEGYLLAKIKMEKSEISAKVGRQRIFYGEHRVLGTFDWSNISNSFDGLKVSCSTEYITSDLFSLDLRKNTVKEGPAETPTTNKGTSALYGSYNTLKFVPYNLVDIYGLYLYDGVKSKNAGVGFENVTRTAEKSANIFAVGLRFEGDTKELIEEYKPFWALEGVWEFGNAWADELQAYALSARVGSTFKVILSPKIFVEYDMASGTSREDKNKGIRKTFYNFFPTNHLHYGYSDLFSWKNMQGLRGSFSLKPINDFELSFDVWKFFLFSKEDWWYEASQLPRKVKLSPPYTSDDAGLEFDTVLVYKFKGLIGEGGYSIFLPGKLSEDLGLKDPQHWAYAQLTLNF